MPENPSKRTLILDAAIRVFARKGYHSSRTQDISKEAGVAYGSLYSYFTSKDEILLSIYQERWKILLDHIEKVQENLTDPDERIEAIIDFIFRSYQRNPEMMKVLIMDVPRLHQFYSPENWKLYYSFFKAMIDIFSIGQEKGLYNKEVSPFIAACSIYGAVDTTIRQYVYNAKFTQDVFSIEQAKQQIVKLLKQGYLKRKD